VIVAAIEGGLVLAVEFVGFQDHLVQVQEAVACAALRYIPVYAVVFLEIDPEFQDRHGFYAIYEVTRYNKFNKNQTAGRLYAPTPTSPPGDGSAPAAFCIMKA
jgi:hypothetical protein